MLRTLGPWLLLACSNAPPGQVAEVVDSAEPIPECPVYRAPQYAGCHVEITDDINADGRHPGTWRYLYDAWGRVQGWDYRNAIDGDDQIMCQYSYLTESQDESRLIERCIGRSVYTYSWEYDSDAVPQGKSYDSASDGDVDKVWVYDVDDAGVITRETIDQDLDGEPDSMTSYTLDADGNVVREAWDYGADGVEDFVRTYAWSERGELIEQADDNDADGQVDERISWTYDAWGYLHGIEEDVDGDGDRDAFSEYVYEDCVLSYVDERDEDGGEARTTYTWDAAGRPAVQITDYDKDDTVEVVRTWVIGCP